MRGRYRLPPLNELAEVFLWRPRFVLLGLAVALFTVVECVAVSVNNGWKLESALRVAGFLIGLAGLVVVAYGLSKTRRLFGKPSVWSRLCAWWRAVLSLFLKGRPVSIQASVGAGGIKLEGFAPSVHIGPKTIEQRVEELERRAAAAEKRAEEIRTEARQALEHARAELRADQGRIQQSVGNLSRQLEEFSVGGLDLEGMGLWWLMLGSFLSTLNDWVAGWGMIWRTFM